MKTIIYNVLGSEIKSIELNSSTTKLNISDLNDGVYFIRVHVENKTIIRKFGVE